MQWIYDFDLSTFRAINLGWRSPVLDVVFLIFSCLGLGYVQAGLSALTLISSKTRAVFWPLILAIVISGLPVTQGLKAIIYRERPSHLDWAVRQEGFLFDSFPSGHTSTSFAVAVLLAFTLKSPKGRAIAAGVGLAAVGVGLSRIYRGVHWPTDVIAGMFSGMVGGSVSYLTFRIKLANLSVE